jgi:hypothetical protein
MASSPTVLPKLAVVGLTTLQAVARPSEVDDRRQTTANAEALVCRSAAI